ncbi:SCO family protein [Aliikangiella maris]|uniref:SCO family protein n=2 Tax=Aliikangiella maris TaxID=3162458 RepID=A0ABV3MT16_9GAMM
MIKKILWASMLLTMLNACDGIFQAKAPEFTQLLVFPKKNPVAGFSLSKHDGERFDTKNFTGHWNLIFIGYTHCPDVCPMTLTDITNIYKNIDPELQKHFQIIFLSVDPKRDTLPHLADYIEHFHDDFVAITGDKNEIDKIVSVLGGIYHINDEDEKYYTVDHTAKIFIVSPTGERYGIITSEAMHNKDKSNLVKDLNRLAQTGI